MYVCSSLDRIGLTRVRSRSIVCNRPHVWHIQHLDKYRRGGFVAQPNVESDGTTLTSTITTTYDYIHYPGECTE